MNTQTKHAESGCTDYLQHPWESCPENKPNKAQHSPQWYGAFDEGGNLRATFDSPSEAYHYTQSRGHMHDGSDKPIVNHADKLAEALRDLLDVCERVHGLTLPVHLGAFCEEQDWTTAMRNARATKAAYEDAQ